MLSYITWTVKPIAFTLFGLSIHWYGLLMAFGFILGLRTGNRLCKMDGGKEYWSDIIFFALIIATLVGLRLGHCLFYEWDYYSHLPLEILKIWKGGMASHGAAIAIPIALWLCSKFVTHRSTIWILDIVVITTALVAFLIRLGNLLNHEIYGVATDLPWGFRFVQNVNDWQAGASPVFGEPSHPTQIYESLSYLVVYLVIYLLYTKKPMVKRREGLIFGIFLFGIFFSRFFIEFIKRDQVPFEANMTLNMGQALSIPFILLGVFFFVRALVRKPVYYEGMIPKPEKTL